ncbi:hypothetical protein [Shimia sp.]|jgi:hypothetical protein|uniref:hypothetical protein n=1 Tax=unclassified Shimia TaxID=2630038 RepID=UPI0025E76E8F|nr:hypothetical protein [Shimia sp.]MCH2066496.1 hypothetical protein [Shimia sp.]
MTPSRRIIAVAIFVLCALFIVRANTDVFVDRSVQSVGERSVGEDAATYESYLRAQGYYVQIFEDGDWKSDLQFAFPTSLFLEQGHKVRASCPEVSCTYVSGRKIVGPLGKLTQFEHVYHVVFAKRDGVIVSVFFDTSPWRYRKWA